MLVKNLFKKFILLFAFAGIFYTIFRKKDGVNQKVYQSQQAHGLTKTALSVIGGKKAGFESVAATTPLQQLSFNGTLPSWLQGTLLGTGPALFELGPTRAAYWFNGLALLHGFYFDGKTITYHNNFLDSVYYQRCMKNGKFDSGMSADEKPKGFFARVASAAFSAPEPYDNGNLGIAHINNSFIALTETTLGVEIDPKTLQTIKPFDLNESLEGHLTTAQFHYDCVTHAWYNYLINFGTTSNYTLYKITNDNKVELITSLPVKLPSYMRSVAMTKNYVVLIEVPFVINPLDLLLSAGAFIEKIQWKPELGTNFIVVNKHTGEVKGNYKTATPLLIFNSINAFEDNDTLIVDVTAYADNKIVPYTKLEALCSDDAHEFEPSYPVRFTIDFSHNSVKYNRLCKATVESPTFNEQHYAMEPYSYIYGTSAEKPTQFPSKLIKLNIVNKNVQLWSQQDCYASKPVFVQKPDAKSEDEGVLLSIVFDGNNKKSFLLILDAQSFTELGKAELPCAIPLGVATLFNPSV